MLPDQSPWEVEGCTCSFKMFSWVGMACMVIRELIEGS
jgi:hypothetical protein